MDQVPPPGQERPLSDSSLRAAGPPPAPSSLRSLPEAERAGARGAIEAMAQAQGFDGKAAALVDAMARGLRLDRVYLGLSQAHGARLHPGGAFPALPDAETRRAIEEAMDESLDQGKRLLHLEPGSGEKDPLASSDCLVVTRAHRRLARVLGCRSIWTCPLLDGARPVGVLAVALADDDLDAATLQAGDLIGAAAGAILGAERRLEAPLGRRLAAGAAALPAAILGRRFLGRKLLAAVLLGGAAASAALSLEYRVRGRARIEGELQRAAPAPFDGFIKEAPVRAGDTVAKGALLCALDDRDLDLERLRLAHLREQLEKQYQQALALRRAADVRILKARLESTGAELELVLERLARTRVVAPMDAVIIAGDLSQSIGSPVSRGEALFHLAPTEGYRVVLEVDERDIIDLAVGQKGVLVLAALAEDDLPLVVSRITPVSAAGEGRNAFRVEARLDRPDARLRPGMEGVAKVAVGRRRLMWILGHRFWDWWRLRVWSWLP